MPFESAVAVPWQIAYPDDEFYPADDLVETAVLVTINPNFPSIADKPTELGGLRSQNREAKATIKTCAEERKGKFEIEIEAPGTTVAKYTSTKEFTVEHFTTKTFVFNAKFNGGVTSVPFNAPNSDVEWTPKEFFKMNPVDQEAEGIIKVKFAGQKIGETKFTIKKTRDWSILWKALPLGGDFKIAKDRLIAEANRRATDAPAFIIKANFPVMESRYFPVGGLIAADWPDTKNVRLVDWLNMGFIQRHNTAEKLTAAWSLAAQRGGFSQILFVVQDGFFGVADTTIGQAGTNAAPKAAFVKEGAASTTDAHELGHLLPWKLFHDYTTTSVGDRAIGYLSTVTELFPSTFESARPTSSAAEYPLTFSMMGSANSLFYTMIRKDQYRTVLLHFLPKPGKIIVDPPLWLLRGVVKATGSTVTGFEPMPIYSFDGFETESEPCFIDPQCVTLKVKMTLSDNSVVEKELAVKTQGFYLDFSNPDVVASDTFAVVDAVLMPELPVKKVRVEDKNGQLLYEKIVSLNAPTLEITSVDVKSNKIEIKTKSSDADKDTLYASVFIEYSSGLSDAAMLDNKLNGLANKFTIDSVLPPGDYKALVMVTDGFNTVEKKMPFTVTPALLAASTETTPASGNTVEVITV